MRLARSHIATLQLAGLAAFLCGAPGGFAQPVGSPSTRAIASGSSAQAIAAASSAQATTPDLIAAQVVDRRPEYQAA